MDTPTVVTIEIDDIRPDIVIKYNPDPHGFSRQIYMAYWLQDTENGKLKRGGQFVRGRTPHEAASNLEKANY